MPVSASSAGTLSGPPSWVSASSTGVTLRGSGIAAVAKYSQMRSSDSAAGSSTASALSMARPARPTCW